VTRKPFAWIIERTFGRFRIFRRMFGGVWEHYYHSFMQWNYGTAKRS
jgi:hypothetical protein